MKKIIISTGYMGSGSSAITDLISEFKNCQNEYKSFEYVMLHMPNGLFDLEDKLLRNNTAVRSDEAIRTFEDTMSKLYNKKYWWIGHYNKIISPNFKNITDNYISKIQQYNFNSYYYMQEEVNTKMFFKLLLQKPLKILNKNVKFKKVLKYKDGMRISFIKPEEFYKYSHDYIYEIINEISKGKDNVILDQFLVPFNLYRIDNYFDDNTKAIVVERDPRDVYILNKYIWPSKDYEVPMPTGALDFSNFYKGMRESEKECTSKKVLRIKFEDLIYNYDKTLKKIMNFLEFKESDHKYKLSRFNPDISIKNTQLFRKKEYEKEIKIIEKELSKYLYDFPYEINNSVEDTIEFE